MKKLIYILILGLFTQCSNEINQFVQPEPFGVYKLVGYTNTRGKVAIMTPCQEQTTFTITEIYRMRFYNNPNNQPCSFTDFGGNYTINYNNRIIQVFGDEVITITYKIERNQLILNDGKWIYTTEKI